MCPGCIGSTLLLLSGAGSAGGLAALKLKSLRRIKAVSEGLFACSHPLRRLVAGVSRASPVSGPEWTSSGRPDTDSRWTK